MLFNPFYFSRKELYKSIIKYAPLFNGKLVDLGCGTKPYAHAFTQVDNYIGLDIEQSGNTDSKSMVDVYYDGKKFPFDDGSIDGVFSSETFEHIFNLEEIIIEINRVLKNNGMLLATCPFLWPEHEVPYDFARYTSFGLKHLLQKHGFEIIAFDKTGNYFTAMLQLRALYFYFFINRIPILNHVFFVVFITPIFLFGSFVNRILPGFMKRKDLYLNNVILAKKIS
ncbi:MAG: class I SAM-dependent methyltransferase [Chitinophagaceae bacterium]|nr:class I SAM-dependent methyltransferase [Chitinophagaceae bacterium]